MVNSGNTKMELYFSHFQGDKFLVKSKDEYQKALLKYPKAEMMLIDGNVVRFFNDSSLGDKEFIIGDLSGDIVVIDAEDKKSLIGCYGKRVIGINISGPQVLSNYPFWRAAVELSDKFYVLPNGKVFEDKRAVKGWVKKLGHEKIEFNKNSYLEASKLAKYTQKGLIKTVKKPKNKSDNPFFNPNFMQKQQKQTKSVVVGRKNALSAKKELEDTITTCDSCRFMEKCPQFQAGAVCAYSKRFKALAPLVKTRDLDLLSETLQEIMAIESKRYLRGVTQEEITGDLDPVVSQIGTNLFAKVKDFMTIMKPVLNQQTQYNILNQNVNIGISVEKLENAGLSEEQRGNLAEEIEGILKEQKRKATTGTTVATEESTV